MKICVLLVTYNQERYVLECLNSIIMQKTNFGVEVIVADDFSTDKTLSIITETLAKEEINFTILPSQKNVGLAKNYQRGFKACKGDYIAVIEGDDYWSDPNRLQKHVDFLENSKVCVLSFNRLIFFHEETQRFELQPWINSEDFEYFTSSDLARGNKIGNLSACVFRKSAVDLLPPGIFDIEIADWMLGISMGQFGLLAKQKDPMTVYRIHPSGLWSGLSKKGGSDKILELANVYNEFLEFRFDKEFSELKKGWLKKNNLKNSIIGYLPPVFVFILKLLIPPKVLSFLNK